MLLLSKYLNLVLSCLLWSCIRLLELLKRQPTFIPSMISHFDLCSVVSIKQVFKKSIMDKFIFRTCSSHHANLQVLWDSEAVLVINRWFLYMLNFVFDISDIPLWWMPCQTGISSRGILFHLLRPLFCRIPCLPHLN